MIFFMKYWFEILLVGIIVMVLGYIKYQDSQIVSLNAKVKAYEQQSEMLLTEYTNNIKAYNDKSARIEIVYKDRIKYIKENVDENDSCEDVIDKLNRYQF